MATMIIAPRKATVVRIMAKAKAEMESVLSAAKKFIEETKIIFMPKTDSGRR